MAQDILLVGSIPFDTPEQVMRMCGAKLGNHAAYYPDGETYERIWWVNMLAYRVFHGHPEIETVRRPPPENGVEKWKPGDRNELWQFAVKPGVKAVRFGEPGWRLNYTKDAVGSYFVFKTLRKEGLLPAEARFQVCIPLTNSAIDVFFHNPDDYDRIKPGFEESVRAEISKMCELIPPDDLAIQWDCCIELMDLEGNFPWTPKENKLERNVAPVERLSPHIPKEVKLGYHLCYGTLGGWPMVQTAKDLSTAVNWANLAVARSGRHVDFVHIPVLDRTDDPYYAPLKNLKVGDARVYLGLVHGDRQAISERIRTAKKFVKDFGIGAYCGLGRHRPEQVAGILDDHVAALETLHGH